jgi:hypothetical protein
MAVALAGASLGSTALPAERRRGNVQRTLNGGKSDA